VAIAERKAQEGPLSLGYYLGVALPLWPTWFLFSAIGAWIGQSFGNLAALGDFGLAAMFITIIAVSGRTADRRCDWAPVHWLRSSPSFTCRGNGSFWLGGLACGVIVAAAVTQ